MPQQPVALAGEQEGQADLAVDLGEPARVAAQVEGAVLEAAGAVEVLVGRQLEGLLDGQRRSVGASRKRRLPVDGSSSTCSCGSVQRVTPSRALRLNAGGLAPGTSTRLDATGRLAASRGTTRTRTAAASSAVSCSTPSARGSSTSGRSLAAQAGRV
jgi:hypothetical protein